MVDYIVLQMDFQKVEMNEGKEIGIEGVKQLILNENENSSLQKRAQNDHKLCRSQIV